MLSNSISITLRVRSLFGIHCVDVRKLALHFSTPLRFVKKHYQ